MARQFQAQCMAEQAARRAAAAAGETPIPATASSTLTPTTEPENNPNLSKNPPQPRMWKPWNQPKTRIYDNRAHFVEVVYDWYRAAWAPNFEAELKQEKGTDNRGIEYVTISCPYSMRAGIHCGFSFTARAIRRGEKKCDLAKYTERHCPHCPCRQAASVLPTTQLPALSSANTSTATRTSLSKRGPLHKKGQFRPANLTSTSSLDTNTSFDESALVHSQAPTSNTTTSHSVSSSYPPPKRASNNSWDQRSSNSLPGTGSNSTPIAKNNNRQFSGSSAPSVVPFSNYPDFSTASQPSNSSAAAVGHSKNPLTFTTSRLDALAAASSLAEVSSTAPWDILSDRTSPLPFPPQKIITSPTRFAAAGLPTQDTDPITPEILAEQAGKTVSSTISLPISNASTLPEPVSAPGLAPTPTSAFYSSTAITEERTPPLPQEVASIPPPWHKIAIALPPKVALPNRKSPLDIVVNSPAVKLPTSVSKAAGPPREDTAVSGAGQQGKTMPATRGPAASTSTPAAAKNGLMKLRPLPSFKRLPTNPDNAVASTAISQMRDETITPSTSTSTTRTSMPSASFPVKHSTLFMPGKTAQGGLSYTGNKKMLPARRAPPVFVGRKKVLPARRGAPYSPRTFAPRTVSADSSSSSAEPDASDAADSGPRTTSDSLASSWMVPASASLQAQPPAQLQEVTTSERSHSTAKAPPAITSSTSAGPNCMSAHSVPVGPKPNGSVQTSVPPESSSIVALNKEKAPVIKAAEQEIVKDSACTGQATTNAPAQSSTEKTLGDTSTEQVATRKSVETHFERRKPEKLTIRSTSKNYRKELKIDKQGIDSVNLLAAFEGSASPSNSPSNPIAPSVQAERLRYSAGSPVILTGVTSMSGTSSARSSRSPAARGRSSDTSNPGYEDQMVIDGYPKTRTQSQAETQSSKAEPSVMPRISTPNIPKRATSQAPPLHLVIEIESDASSDVDELEHSHMDIDNNDSSFGMSTPKSSVVHGTANLVTGATNTPPVSAIKAALSRAVQPSLWTSDSRTISRENLSEGNTLKDKGEKRKAADMSGDSKPRPSPSRLTFSDIEAMSSSENELGERRDGTLIIRNKTVVDEEVTLVNSSNGKKKRKKKIMLSDSESEEEIPIAQLAASLSSAGSTPILQQDVATMQVDPIVDKEGDPGTSRRTEEKADPHHIEIENAQESTIPTEDRKRKKSPLLHKNNKVGEKKLKQNHNETIAGKGEQKEDGRDIEDSKDSKEHARKLLDSKDIIHSPEIRAMESSVVSAAQRRAEDPIRQAAWELKARKRAEYQDNKQKERRQKRQKRRAAERQEAKEKEEEEERLAEEKLKEEEEERKLKAEKPARKEQAELGSRPAVAEHVPNQEDDKQTTEGDETMQIDRKETARPESESPDKPDKGEVDKNTLAPTPTQTLQEILAASQLEVFLPCVRYVKAFHELGFKTLADLKKAGIFNKEQDMLQDMMDLLDMMAGLNFDNLEKDPKKNPIKEWAIQRILKKTNETCGLLPAKGSKHRSSLTPFSLNGPSSK